MGLDIRWPIGLMFSLIGALLTLFGLTKGDASTSLGININLIWGLVLLVFGVAMVIGAATGKKDNPPSV